MDASLDMRNVKTIRLTADSIIIEGMTMDINMLNLENRDTNASSAASPGASSLPAEPAVRGPTTRSNPRLVAKEHAEDGKFHLLLAASGSVATIKIPNIVRGLAKVKNLSIRILLTESATRFLQGQSEEQPNLDIIAQYPNVDAIYRDEDEWKEPWVRGAPILHIELRRWADLLVIAPLSANTLAKISNGMCDNLLTSVVRAWQVEAVLDSVAEDKDSRSSTPEQKRIIVAPAMNTAMWRHPLTAQHLRASNDDKYYHWFDVLRPVEKELACGDTGDGAMCDWKKIVDVIAGRIQIYKQKDPLGLLFE
jgi:phosphopantothenoylcysteine decarboxylase